MRAQSFDKRNFVKLLHQNGYYLVRTRGSHFLYQNSQGNTISVNKNINRMVARRLIKENGLHN